jgi:predicted alpha/beta-hydrolase family hydrolase
VIDAVRRERRAHQTVLAIGGKSMGGRIASQVAAGTAAIAAVVLLGYPLHPPGKLRQLRAGHLPKVAAPILFVQGARDNFGTADELRRVIESFRSAELYVVDNGDHSFKVPKRTGVPQEVVYSAIQDKVADWLFKLSEATEQS